MECILNFHNRGKTVHPNLHHMDLVFNSCTYKIPTSFSDLTQNSIFQYLFSVSAREDPVQQEGHCADPDSGAPAGHPRTPEPGFRYST